MSLADFPGYFHEALALHSIFEQGFGIDTADIYVRYVRFGATRRVKGGYLLAVLARQGDLEFSVTVTVKAEMSREEFVRQWPKATKLWNALDEEDKIAFRDATNVRRDAAQILSEMALKGFKQQRRFEC